MERPLRRLALGAVGLALAACVPVPIGRVTVTVQSNRAIAAAAPVVAARLSERLGSVVDALAALVRNRPDVTDPRGRAAVAGAIDRTERDLLAVLDDPELVGDLLVDLRDLAPLRDYVRAEADAARSALGVATESQARLFALPPFAALGNGANQRAHRRPVPGGWPPRTTLRLAAQDDSGGGDAGALDRFLSAVASLRRRADARDLQTTLCVVSRPEGADFSVFPASAQDRVRRVQSIGRLANLFRGTYRYVADLEGVRFEGENLDLLNPQNATLECAWRSNKASCSERSGLLRTCGAA